MRKNWKEVKLSDYKWTVEWPTEPRDYWFYGWDFGNTGLNKNDKPRLHFVKVRRGAVSLFYDAGSHFLYKRDAIGMWTPIRLPTLPDLGGLK